MMTLGFYLFIFALVFGSGLEVYEAWRRGKKVTAIRAKQASAKSKDD
jgi:hypothetical protein